ncbi:MAG TPA: BlaI/MecI/CopY family transcriptional regulator [Polyangia bacterium]|nr:BlaI/MecI/CopY family transcriptional regulator [Polyangia bacterium]
MTDDASAVPGGKLEYAVLVALWELGPLSGRDIHDRVGVPLGLVYTTTAKVLDRLHIKGLVGRERRGRVFVYEARAPRASVERARAVKTLSGLFGETARPALTALVDAVEAIDPRLLDDLARAIEARRRTRTERDARGPREGEGDES